MAVIARAAPVGEAGRPLHVVHEDEALPAARAGHRGAQRVALGGAIVVDDDEEVEHPVRRQREVFEAVEPERRARVADVQLDRLAVLRVELLLRHLLAAARAVHRGGDGPAYPSADPHSGQNLLGRSIRAWHFAQTTVFVAPALPWAEPAVA